MREKFQPEDEATWKGAQPYGSCGAAPHTGICCHLIRTRMPRSARVAPATQTRMQLNAATPTAPGAQLFYTNAAIECSPSFTVVTGVYFWSVNEINEKKKLLAATPNSTFTRHVRYSPVSTQRRHISRLTSSRPRARRPDKCVVDSFDVVVLVLARAGAPTDMTVVWALCRQVSVRSHCAGAHLHSAPSPTPSTPPSLSSTPNSGSSRRHSHSSRAAANHTSG